MKYAIYQPKEINFIYKSKQLYSKDDYKLVYEGELNDEIASQDTDWILERLFSIFNISRPADFKGHSLSVNDIVVLDNNDEDGFSLKSGAYICANLGWERTQLA